LNNLGTCYAEGKGVQQDYAQATHYLRSAAAKGNADAENSLGVMQLKGWGGAQDLGEARRYFEMAAQQGNAPGMLDLGLLYARGQGVPQSDAAARKWFRLAADAGSAEAAAELKKLGAEVAPATDAIDAADPCRAFEGSSALSASFALDNGSLSVDDLSRCFSKMTPGHQHVLELSTGNPAALEWLSQQGTMVRMNLLFNRKLPAGLRARLKQDPDPSIKALARRPPFGASSPAATGAAPVTSINVEQAGNLQPSHDLGCVDLKDVTDQDTPVDLYRAMAQCVGQGDYERAAYLRTAGTLFGRFDQMRVKDKTAQDAVAVLRLETEGALPADQRTAFQAELSRLIKKDAFREGLCAAMHALRPPEYYPRYMVAHGMNAFQGGTPGGELVDPFDADKAWRASVDPYLNCK
jgi:TPR repeat protein